MRDGPWRFVATGANGQPAFAYYLADGERGGWVRQGLLVVGVGGDGITSVTRFRDDGLLDRFDLPARL
jgi:RNA polymerase sigma-70 factor (ECF subfamily)